MKLESTLLVAFVLAVASAAVTGCGSSRAGGGGSGGSGGSAAAGPAVLAAPIPLDSFARKQAKVVIAALKKYVMINTDASGETRSSLRIGDGTKLDQADMAEL